MGTISEETVRDLAQLTYELIEAKKTLAKCEEVMGFHNNEDWRRMHSAEIPAKSRGLWLQLGIPTALDSGCHRMVQVSPKLGIAVVRSHIADIEARIVSANEVARVELEAAVA